MVKKLKATGLRFSAAAIQARAATREAREAEEAQYKKMMNTTILTPECLVPLEKSPGNRSTRVTLNDEVIAMVHAGPDGVFVELENDEQTSFQIRNTEACQPLLTYRKIAIANMFAGGGARLAQLVRQRDAEAEAEQLLAVIGNPLVSANQNRL